MGSNVNGNLEYKDGGFKSVVVWVGHGMFNKSFGDIYLEEIKLDLYNFLLTPK